MFTVLTALCYGVLGTLIGSFLGVVVDRRGTGVSVVVGRSHCDACGTSLSWYELIPIISWVSLRGRCGTCGSKLSYAYPLIELATGVLFALVGALMLPLLLQCLLLAMVSLLVLITVYDIRHTIIPDEWVYPFALTALMVGIYTAAPGAVGEWGILLVSGPVVALPLYALWFVSRGAWMGLGDAKLCLGIGWLLGPVYGLYALMGAFVLGAVVSILFLVVLPYCLARLYTGKSHDGSGEGYTMKSEVPFGPFLIASCLIVWFLLAYGLNVPLPIIGF